MTTTLTKKNCEVKLDVHARRQLKELEKTVDAGLATVFDVGAALMKIRDLELYRETHTSFEKYIVDRFNISRPRAYQLIDASEVRQSLSTVVDNNTLSLLTERHCRELANVDDDDLKVVIDKALETAGDKPLTATVIKNVVAEFLSEPATGGDPIEIDSGDDQPESLEPAEIAIRDKYLVDQFRVKINELIHDLKNVEEVPATVRLRRKVQPILMELANAKAWIVCCIPYMVCSICSGGGCPNCDELGWIDAQTAKNIAE